MFVVFILFLFQLLLLNCVFLVACSMVVKSSSPCACVCSLAETQLCFSLWRILLVSSDTQPNPVQFINNSVNDAVDVLVIKEIC